MFEGPTCPRWAKHYGKNYVVGLGVWFVAKEQIGALSVALRQVAPIVATGEELAFLTGAGPTATARLRDDVSRTFGIRSSMKPSRTRSRYPRDAAC